MAIFGAPLAQPLPRRAPRGAALLVLVWVALWGTGCASPYAGAMHAFEEARYPRAAAEFRRAERVFVELPRDEQARYALYRGLTHFALGDAREADRWLSHAKHLSDRDPWL